MYVSIRKLSSYFDVSKDMIKPKIPSKFILKIGKSVRYDLKGIEHYFKTGASQHDNLIEDLLK